MNFRRAASCFALALLNACGSSSPAAPTVPTAPTILVQPLDQTVAPGQTTTFTVQADAGGTSATYKWSWNGADIEGATSASFTTRAAEVADNGSTFAVTVRNLAGSVTSQDATLTVSPAPRAPRKGDLRFQGVGAVPFRRAPMISDILSNQQIGFRGVAGTPLSLETGLTPATPTQGSAWFYATTQLPPSSQATRVDYTGNMGTTRMTDLMSQASTSNGVITSLDFVDENTTYAWSRVGSVGQDYFAVWSVVSPTDVASHVALEGAHGRVITAVAAHAGTVWIVSHARAGEPPTVYDTSVRGATGSTVGQVSSGLAADGYIITAMGRDGAGGLMLVGTRVQGDRMARPLAVVTGADVPQDLLLRGYAIVGYVFDRDSLAWTWIAQQ